MTVVSLGTCDLAEPSTFKEQEQLAKYIMKGRATIDVVKVAIDLIANSNGLFKRALGKELKLYLFDNNTNDVYEYLAQYTTDLTRDPNEEQKNLIKRKKFKPFAEEAFKPEQWIRFIGAFADQAREAINRLNIDATTEEEITEDKIDEVGRKLIRVLKPFSFAELIIGLVPTMGTKLIEMPVMTDAIIHRYQVMIDIMITESMKPTFVIKPQLLAKDVQEFKLNEKVYLLDWNRYDLFKVEIKKIHRKEDLIAYDVYCDGYRFPKLNIFGTHLFYANEDLDAIFETQEKMRTEVIKLAENRANGIESSDDSDYSDVQFEDIRPKRWRHTTDPAIWIYH